MNFTFANPVCEITSLRFLDLEKMEKVFVTGTDVFDTVLERRRVPPGGHTKPTILVLDDYFSIASLYVEFGEGDTRSTGALAAINLRMCTGKFPAKTELALLFHSFRPNFVF